MATANIANGTGVKNRVKIAFVMQNEPIECYHVAIILPDDSFYDGGIMFFYVVRKF